ncbi:AI-2E family transporter [Halobacillus andaensis]|uniref:AI-2E family transporter n=1 Tax=Halobacillus andaensis TaxID=1176239 RepID=A0A917B563_HALAA|nr:AI-2E family transporter [Halobacillus andaensis]MBP2004492.1 putative PurR-regulated permease PerM [Halobacillus andaensis]GGF21227.1 AI-2E family transporter [Halobacillus andaensis]
MIHKRWFQVLITGILLSLLILLLHEIQFFFAPFLTYAGAIAFPLIGGAILFYISRPVMHLLEHYKIPRLLAIVIVFLLYILAGFFIVRFIAPIAQEQFTRLVENIPRMSDMIGETITYWQQNQDIIPSQFNDSLNGVVESLQSSLDAAPGVIIDVISQLVGFVFGLVLIPFFLFFMLKDGHKLVPFIKQFMNKRVSASFEKLTKSLDHTLNSFIIGQLTVSVFVGLMLLVGYLIIGLNYSLTLALFAMLMNVIPFVGPFLAVIPAILVALFQDPIMAVYVAIITIVAQQLEGNLVSPNVMGKALSIHPLTIITIILAAGSLAGFLGLLFAIPAYAVIKTIISHFYNEWLERKAAHE